MKSFKLITPPILYNLLGNIKKKIRNSNKYIDPRRWWDGEIINSHNYKFNKIFEDFNSKTFAVTINKETRDCIDILPNQTKILKLKKLDISNRLLFGLGNLSNKDPIKGLVNVFIDNKKTIELSNPCRNKWENFIVNIENTSHDIKILNKTNENIFISCPTYLLDKKSDEIDNIVIVFIDQIDNETFSKLEDKNLIPFTSSFFKNSISFENFFSNSEWTVPSIYSFFNSQYSSRHGMFDFNFSRNISDPLNNDNLLKYLNEKNYFSLGISRSKGHHPGFGFQKYFDRFFYFPANREKFREDDFEQKIIEHLETNLNGKNFVFAHFLSSHTPFYNPSINEEVNYSNKRVGNSFIDFQDSILETGSSKIEKVIKKDKVESINIKQAERLKAIDLSLNKLFNYIEKKNKDRTLVILTSDHGLNHIENKDENFLNKNRLNVPLKIFHPQINKKTLVSDLASSVDIFNIVKILNKKDPNIDKIFEKNFFKNEIISESIFGNEYKISFRSKKIIFDYSCFLNTDTKTIYLNKSSKKRIKLLTDENIDEDEILENYLKKIITHVKSGNLLNIQN